MFERFTDRARRVVVLSQEASRELNHNFIGVEHLLLGLLHEGEGIAGQALQSFGLTYPDLVERVVENAPRGAHPVEGHIPFTPRLKKVLELGLREALQLGHNFIGTEHLLLGVCRDASSERCDGIVAGVHHNDVRRTVLELIGMDADVMPAPRAARPRPRTEHVAPAGPMLHNAHLQDLLRELDKKAIDTDVLDFGRMTSEDATDAAGVYTEVITVRWRRRNV